MSNSILLTINEDIAVITLNRPYSLNTFNESMTINFKKITDTILKDKEIRAVLINGNGRAFSAGADLTYICDRMDVIAQDVVQFIGNIHDGISNLLRMDKPVLASVHGIVAGVGLSIMAACDMVIAAANTEFCAGYSNIGLSPDGGLTFTLPRLVGVKKAMELLMMSKFIGAEQAEILGLVNQVVPDNMLEIETNNFIQALAHGPSCAYGKIKTLLNHTMAHTLEEQLAAEAHAFAKTAATEDFKAGIMAYKQKRKPKFSGK